MLTEPKPEHGTPSWLRSRQRSADGRVRFGASEVPTLMGVNPFANLIDLFIDKMNPDPQSIRSAAFHRGNVLEQPLVEEAGREFGFVPVIPEVMFCEGRLLANLDGADHPTNPTIIVEAKTSTRYDISDPIPDPYYWQAVGQLATTNADTVIVVCLDRRQTIGYWNVHREEVVEQIDGLLIRAEEIGRLFDESEMPKDIEPTQEQINRIFPSPVGSRELSSDELKIVRDWSAVKAELDLVKETEKELRDRVATLIGEHEAVSFAGETIVTYKIRKNGSRFDQERFKETHLTLFNEYLKDGGTTRVLRLTKGN